MAVIEKLIQVKGVLSETLSQPLRDDLLNRFHGDIAEV